MALTLPYRLFTHLLSPAGRSARLSILIYHRVLPEVDPIFPYEATEAVFDAQLRLLKGVFNILPLPDAIARLKDGSLPARAACITFDDGYANNYLYAAPILQRHGLSATFFLASAYLDGGRMFNDTVVEAIRRARDERIDLTRLGLGMHDVSTYAAKTQAIERILPIVKYLPAGRREDTVAELARLVTDQPLPDDLMLTAAQVRGLADMGMEIGGHTHRHPILASLDDAAARAEIAAGKECLEAMTGRPLRVFAYPNGKPGTDYLPDQSRIVRQLGLEGAVTTRQGAARLGDDPYQLPRYTPLRPGLGSYLPMLMGNLLRSQ